MAYTRTSGSLATRNFVPQIFSPLVAAIFDHQCVAMDCVNRDWEGEIANAGDSVRIRGFGNINVSNYVPDSTTIAYQTTSESGQNLIVDQMKYAAYKIDDVDAQQTDLEANTGYAERLGVAFQETVDTFLLSDMSAAVPVYNTMGAPINGHVVEIDTSNCYDVFTDLYAVLEESKVFGRTNQRPWVIVPPKIKAIMKRTSQMTHATDLADDVIRNGVIGEFARFDVKVTTNLTFTGATPADTYDNYWQILAGVNLAYTFAQQINMNESIRLEGQFGDGERALMVYGGKAINADGLAKAFVKAA
jgi:hypothetical protein